MGQEKWGKKSLDMNEERQQQQENATSDGFLGKRANFPNYGPCVSSEEVHPVSVAEVTDRFMRYR